MTSENSVQHSALLAPPLGPTSGSAREGLHSLFRRVCEKNQLSVNDLFSALVIPRQGITLEKLANTGAGIHLINRGADFAEKFIARIEALTTINDGRMLTLADLNELRGVGKITMSPHRKWCPHCLEDDLDSEIGPHDRLLWSIDYVMACPIHRVQLQNICVTCGTSKMSVLTGKDISGRCPQCTAWLGGKSKLLEEDRDEHSKYILWTAQSFADLLDSPLPFNFNVQPEFVHVLSRLTEQFFNGVYAHLAKNLERNKSVIGTWLAGKAAPSWQALCEISYTFHLPLFDLLMGNCDAVLFSVPRRLPLAIATRLLNPRKKPARINIDQIRDFLVKVTNGECANLITMEAVATQLDTSAREIRRIVPEEAAQLSKVLAERRTVVRERMHTHRMNVLVREIPLAISRLSNLGVRPVRRSILMELGRKGLSLNRSEMKLVMKFARSSNANEIADINSGNK